jgi:hypothetical protein
VGKHAAADGSGVDPLVAAALAGRAPEVVGAHRDGADPASSEAEVGWPEPPAPGGGGLGWPGDLDREQQPAPTRGQQDATSRPAARRGWRRLFGMSPAA